MATPIDKVYSLTIGVQGENAARAIEFDMSAWVEQFPDAAFHILFKPYNAVAPSPMLTEYSAPVLTWIPTLGATAVVGVGYTEVRAIDPDTGLVKKTRIIPTVVESSVTGVDTEDPPEPYADWVNSVLAAGDDAVEANELAQAAKNAAEAARDAAQAAAGDFQGLTATVTELAEGSGPSLEVTHEEGGLYNFAFGIPKGDTGDPAPADQVIPAVDAYLEENFTNPSNPPLDRTLSSSLSAAPADLVGAINNSILQGSLFGFYGASQGNYEDEFTINGIQIKRIGNKFVLNGTAEADTNLFFSKPNITTSVTTANESLHLIVGHRYVVLVSVSSGIGSSESNLNLAVRNKSNVTVVSIGNIRVDLSRVYKSVPFVATGSEAVVYSRLSRTVVFANTEIEVLLVDLDEAEQKTQLDSFTLHQDTADLSANCTLFGACMKNGYSYRGITIIKGYESDSGVPYYKLSGSNENAFGAKYKITNEMDSVPVNMPAAWYDDNLGLIAGKRYVLVVYKIGGDYINTDDADLLFVLRNAADQTKGYVRGNFLSSQYLVSGIFEADGTEAFVVMRVYAHSTFTDLRLRVGVIDVEAVQKRVGVGEVRNSGISYTDAMRPIKTIASDWFYAVSTITGVKDVPGDSDEDPDKTTYYVVSVPRNDSDGNQIPVYADYDESRTPMVYAGENRTTVTCNAGLSGWGGVIKDGVIIKDFQRDNIPDYTVYVAFDADRNVREYKASVTTLSEMVADGVKNACIAYYRLVTNGVVNDVSNIGLPASNLNTNPRMGLFTKADGSLNFIACDGRTSLDAGLKPADFGALMVSLGAVDGWNLDGGGSTSLSINGVKVNKHIDGGGTVDRMIPVTINVPGITPQKFFPRCNQETNGVYTLKCTVVNGRKTYSWEN